MMWHTSDVVMVRTMLVVAMVKTIYNFIIGLLIPCTKHTDSQ